MSKQFNRYNLISVSSDAKTIKGEKKGYLTGILYLAPSTIGGFDVCPNASKGCRASCLYLAGRGAFSNVQKARIRRKALFGNDRKEFMRQLYFDIKHLELNAEQEGMIPCVRLNGTADIDFLNIRYKNKTLFKHFPHVQFYDYTRSHKRLAKRLPKNYHLTLSRDETNGKTIDHVIKYTKHNVAMVFETLPETYNGRKVIDADINDLRFLDPKGVVCGLKPKGKARYDRTGFVIRDKAIA